MAVLGLWGPERQLWPAAEKWGYPTANQPCGSRWQELLMSLNFQANVMFYHRIHGGKWQRKELRPGQTSSCHRAPRHSSSGLAVTQQAPDTELKEISLTSKELCKGSA